MRVAVGYQKDQEKKSDEKDANGNKKEYVRKKI